MAKQIPMVNYLVLDDGEPHLVANECSNCNATYFDRRNACAKCGKAGPFGRKKLATTGKVQSFTIVKRGAPNVPPFVSSVIALDGGGFVKTNLVDVEPDPEKITLNMPVKMKTYVVGKDDEETEAVAFGFAPA